MSGITVNKPEGLTDNMLRPMERWVAESISPEYGNNPIGYITLALACRMFLLGHTCLDLSKLAGKQFPSDAMFNAGLPDVGESITLPNAEEWLEALKSAGITDDFKNGNNSNKPLKLYGTCGADTLVALARHANREYNIAVKLTALALAPSSSTETYEDNLLNKEQLAAINWALNNQFTVIAGMPGTGKTVATARLMARLFSKNPNLIIATAAPSVKAAAKMNESLKIQISLLKSQNLFAPDCCLEETVTVHKLLGINSGSSSAAKNSANPISADVIIIYEASMVSLEMMSLLIDAMRKDAKLILLGDKDQLKSVESGNIFGAICRSAQNLDHAFSKCVHTLVESKRFNLDSTIGKLVLCTLSGDYNAFAKTANESKNRETVFNWVHASDSDKSGIELIIHGLFSEFQKSKTPEDALKILSYTRILCSQNAGSFGVEAINMLCERVLESHYPNRFKPRPIIITQNDHNSSLHNGDIGVIMLDGRSNKFCAYFQDIDGNIKSTLVAKLPGYAYAYAISIHKSQGSEYSRMAVILPSYESRVLRRSLLYTAITRFAPSENSKFFLISKESIIKYTLSHEPEYGSFLPLALTY